MSYGRKVRRACRRPYPIYLSEALRVALSVMGNYEEEEYYVKSSCHHIRK
jgi:hypothetical protein